MKYYVLGTTSGSAYTIGEIVGTGAPRIFDGSGIYVYRLNDALWTTRDFGATWLNIIPTSSTFVTTICQTTGSGTDTTTYITGSGSTIPTWYQAFPETAGSWTSGSAIPSGDMSDSVVSVAQDYSILIGNSKISNAARVWKTTATAPYSATKSDTGFPTTAQVTDLDISEGT